TGSAIEHFAVGDKQAKSASSGNLVGDAYGRFLNLRRPAVGAEKRANTHGLARSGFAVFEPGAFDGEGLAPGHAVDAQRAAVSLGWLMISKCRFFSEFKARRDRSNGIIAGGLPSLPVTAVRWSPVMVPMEPATLTIFVEARSEERVVTTWLRAIGSCTSPRLKNGWPQRKTRSPSTAVTVQAELMEASPCTRTMPAMSPATRWAS